MKVLQGICDWPLLGLMMGTFISRWRNINWSVYAVIRSSSGKSGGDTVKYSSVGNAFLNYKL
jgi:hypothetical protein